MSTSQVTKLNQTHNGDELELYFHLGVSASRSPAGRSTTIQTRTAWARYPIALSHWLSLASRLGHVEHLLVPLPSLAEHVCPQAKSINMALRDARRELIAPRRPREIVAHVRRVLEGLNEWRSDREQVNSASLDGDLQGLSLEQRLWAVRRAMWMLTGPAPHATAKMLAVRYDVPTARACLGMAIAVVSAYLDDAGDLIAGNR